MKKQLLLVPLVGLLCFTSCNKSRELKPVDEKTGLERAAAILQKETAVLTEAAANREKVFDILPKKLSFELKIVQNGKTRKIVQTNPLLIAEHTYNNNVLMDVKCEMNYETLQFHASMSSYNGMNNESNFFYDGTNYYVLSVYNGEKTKITTVATQDEAKAAFLEGALTPDFINFMLPTSYLTKITKYDQDTQKYDLLNAYDYVQNEYLKLYGNDDEHFNYQFGSDDENSFSLKSDLKVALHRGTIASSYDSDIVYNGYSTGTHSAYYNDYINSLDTDFYMQGLGMSVGSAPDLVVFKNNYLNYATSVTKIDIESLPQLFYSAGAFYEHTTQESTLEIKEGANIVNPDPNEYTEQQPQPSIN